AGLGNSLSMAAVHSQKQQRPKEAKASNPEKSGFHLSYLSNLLRKSSRDFFNNAASMTTTFDPVAFATCQRWLGALLPPATAAILHQPQPAALMAALVSHMKPSPLD